jgi:hypothetical protein
LTDDDRWRRIEPPASGPSAPPSPRFDPFATAIGVFAAIVIPVVVIDYEVNHGHVDGDVLAIGIVAGLVVAFLVALWLARRDGQVWRGPQL